MRVFDTCYDGRDKFLAIQRLFITRSSDIDTLPSVLWRGFSLFQSSCVLLLVGFVLRALRSELTCVEFVLALRQDILKSSLEKTRPLRSIMFLISRANSL